MNVNNMFPSKWLKSGDIPDEDLMLTIREVVVEEVGQGDYAEEKPIVYFEETEKGLVLNKTNADTISRLYSPETDNWLGKKIALFSTEVDFGGKQTLAIRVRLKVKGSQATVGNGSMKPALEQVKKNWIAFCEANKVDAATVKAALGTEKVSEWLAADAARTLKAAIGLVEQQLGAY